MRKYTSEKRSESRTFYQFEEMNSKGEKITFELTKCESDGSKGTMPYLWKKHNSRSSIIKKRSREFPSLASGSDSFHKFNSTFFSPYP